MVRKIHKNTFPYAIVKTNRRDENVKIQKLKVIRPVARNGPNKLHETIPHLDGQRAFVIHVNLLRGYLLSSQRLRARTPHCIDDKRRHPSYARCSDFPKKQQNLNTITCRVCVRVNLEPH